MASRQGDATTALHVLEQHIAGEAAAEQGKDAGGMVRHYVLRHAIGASGSVASVADVSGLRTLLACAALKGEWAFRPTRARARPLASGGVPPEARLCSVSETFA